MDYRCRLSGTVTSLNTHDGQLQTPSSFAVSVPKKCLSIVIVALICAQAPLAQMAAGNQFEALAGNSKSYRAVEGGQIDINSADKETLKAAGLDDPSAQRVIAGRPYTAKSQLLSRGILTQAQYERVKSQIIAHRIVGTSNRKNH